MSCSLLSTSRWQGADCARVKQSTGSIRCTGAESQRVTVAPLQLYTPASATAARDLQTPATNAQSPNLVIARGGCYKGAAEEQGWSTVILSYHHATHAPPYGVAGGSSMLNSRSLARGLLRASFVSHNPHVLLFFR